MKLIFLGGIQGAGKTTLMAGLAERFSGKVRIVDPGELFRRYFYRRKTKTISEVEDAVVRKITHAPCKSVVVVHWHYAVLRPSGYIPQIKQVRLEHIARTSRLEQVLLLNVKSSVSDVHKRRLAEHAIKKRNILKKSIVAEFKADKKYLARQHILFKEVLGADRVKTAELQNRDIRVARSRFHALVKSLL